MTQSLKIECLVTDLTLEGEVASFLVTKEQLTAGLSKKADLVDGKIQESNLPDFIANGFQTVNQKLSTLETSITDGIQSAKDYAEAYTDEKLIQKADLVDGKVPASQLPSISEYSGLSEALTSVLDQARRDMIERTDEIQRTKADIGEDGKVLREQLPNYVKIPGLESVIVDLNDSKADISDVYKKSETLNVEEIEATVERISPTRDEVEKSFMMSGVVQIHGFEQKYIDAGGYPYGAVLTLDDGVTEVVSVINNNKNNPNENVIGWMPHGVGKFITGMSYGLNVEVILNNGEKVKSTIADNAMNPNADMTGWAKTNDASQVKYGNQNQAQINARTATPYDHGAIGDGLAHPLSERYASLAEAQAIYPSATSLTEYIDGHALNAWWRDICANNRKFAACHGEFRINTVVSNAGINNSGNSIKTRRIDFNAKIIVHSNTVIENGFEIISPRQSDITGFIEIIDAGGVPWSARRVNNLIYIEDFIHGVFNWKVVTRFARFLGLKAFSGNSSITGLYANNNTSNLGSWQFASCGHRFKHNTFDFTSRSDIGASSATDQRTVLTLSNPHNLGDLTDSIIRFKSKPYLVTGSTDSTITVYPWLEQTDSTGTIEISKGGDFRLEGADSNLINITGGSADCAICAGKEGFYLGVKMGRTNEANDVGLRLGNLISNVQVGGTYHGAYFELNEFDIVKTSLASDNAVLVNPIALNLSKCHVLSPISVSTRRPHPTLINPFTIIYGDKILGPKKLQTYLGINEVTTQTVKLGDGDFKIRSGSATITLSDDINVRRIFGIVDIEFEVFGIASNNGTGSNTTIKHQEGYTINGASGDLIIPPQNAPFKVSARLVNETDWRVYVFYAERPKGSKTHDWASLAAGIQQSTTVTVTGATVGNPAAVSMDAALNGTSLRAEVTAANTVTVYHHNPTAAAVDVASGTLTVKLL